MVFRTGEGIAVLPRLGGGRWLTIGASPPVVRCGLDVTWLRRIVVFVVFGSVTLAVWVACPRSAVAAHWSLEHAVAPAHTKDSDFFGCVVRVEVGMYSRRGPGERRRHWTDVGRALERRGVVDHRTPDRVADSGLLGGFEDVSCISPSQCIATGSADALPLAAQWKGVGWASQRTPEAPAGGDLQGVSCPSVTLCVAAGWLISGATLTEHWDGVSWSIQPTPRPVGARDSTLQDISCASITACAAVGYYTSRTGNEWTLAEHWDGVNWSIQQTPQRSGAKDSDLFRISCAAITACTAVGYYTSRMHKDRMLAERWDGVSWSIERTRSQRAQGTATCSASRARRRRSVRPSAASPTAPARRCRSPSTGTGLAGRSSGPLDPWVLPTATCAGSPAQERRYVPPSEASPTALTQRCHSQSATPRDGTAHANTRCPLPADDRAPSSPRSTHDLSPAPAPLAAQIGHDGSWPRCRASRRPRPFARATFRRLKEPRRARSCSAPR